MDKMLELTTNKDTGDTFICPLKLEICAVSCYWWQDEKCIYPEDEAMPPTAPTAEKTYNCSKCGGQITVGQPFYQKQERGLCHSHMVNWTTEWHAEPNDCVPADKV